MSGAALDRLLAILLVAQLASGLLTLRRESRPRRRCSGSTASSAARCSWRRSRRCVAASGPPFASPMAATGARRPALAARWPPPSSGASRWVASGRILSIGPWTVLTLHVWAALAAVPVVLLHLVPRRWRLLRAPRGGPRMSRRTLLAAAASRARRRRLGRGERCLDAVQGGAGGSPGSRWLPDGGIPPPTTFYGEGTPSLDPAPGGSRSTGRVDAPADAWTWRHSASLGADRARRGPRLHLGLGAADDDGSGTPLACRARGGRGRRRRAVRRSRSA